MLVLVTYDVATATPAGRKRLRAVERACEDFGQRVQNSVFECDVDPGRWAMLRGALLQLSNLEEDSLRFYFLGSKWDGKIEHHGAKPTFDTRGTIIA